MTEGADPRLLARLHLVADIHRGCGIISDQNDCKSDLFSVFLFKGLRADLEFRTDIGRNGLAVDEFHALITPANTPLTNPAEFSVEYLRASPAASLTETTGGTSSTYLISASASKRMALSAV